MVMRHPCASELIDCYVNRAKSLKWKVETLSATRTDIGGIHELSLLVVSKGSPFLLGSLSVDDSSVSFGENSQITLGPFGTFKFESGVYRVQRVPVKDSSRIHTSACSVAVLPSLPQDDGRNELLPASDLKIKTMQASGAGGQHVNTIDSALCITHLPTRITASIQDELSKHKNKQKALRLISTRVRDHHSKEENRVRGETRSSLMGGGDRSERIRTYCTTSPRIELPIIDQRSLAMVLKPYSAEAHKIIS